MSKIYTAGVHLPKTKLGETKMKKIAAATLALLQKKDYHNISIANICNQADMAIGTFYIYFDDKRALYSYLMQDFKMRILATIRSAILDCDTRAQRERAGMIAFVKFAFVYPECFMILWGSLSVDQQLFHDYYVSFANSYAKALTRDCDEVIAIDPVTLAYVLMGITNFVSLRVMLEADMTMDDVESMVDRDIMPLLYHGILRHE